MHDAAMPPPSSPPSFIFCSLSAAPFVALWACFLPLYTFFWWLPVSIVVTEGRLFCGLPDSIPLVGLLHLYATFWTIVDDSWESWWKIGLGTLLLSKVMGIGHEALWDAFEPFVFGREGHGAGTQQTVSRRPPDVRDKDGRPLGPQTVLAPGTQIQLDTHDGQGFQPFILPGCPVFTNERKAIEAIFTADELAALKAVGYKPWDAEAERFLPEERVRQIRTQHGLWKKAQ
jgi:hypothetical protein